jgi:hypothetical protein
MRKVSLTLAKIVSKAIGNVVSPSYLLGHLGQRDRDRTISSLCRAEQGGQGDPIVWCCRWRYSDKLCQWKHGFKKSLTEGKQG